MQKPHLPPYSKKPNAAINDTTEEKKRKENFILENIYAYATYYFKVAKIILKLPQVGVIHESIIHNNANLQQTSFRWTVQHCCHLSRGISIYKPEPKVILEYYDYWCQISKKVFLFAQKEERFMPSLTSLQKIDIRKLQLLPKSEIKLPIPKADSLIKINKPWLNIFYATKIYKSPRNHTPVRYFQTVE